MRQAIALCWCVGCVGVCVFAADRHFIPDSDALLFCGVAWQVVAWWLDGVVKREFSADILEPIVPARSALGLSILRGSLLLFALGIVKVFV